MVCPSGSLLAEPSKLAVELGKITETFAPASAIGGTNDKASL